MKAKCSREKTVPMSNICQGVECVEEQSELGCKVYKPLRRKLFKFQEAK